MTIIDRLYKVSVVLRSASTPSTAPKHIFAHNSGPWAPTGTIFGPNESSECDLSNGKPPRPVGLDWGVIISVQRVKRSIIHKKIEKSIKIDAPGLKISLNLLNMGNKTRGMALEWSRSRRKPKNGSYKGSKIKQKNEQKVKNLDQNRFIA